MLQVDDSRAGMLGKCRRCKKMFRVPGQKRLPPPTAPSPQPSATDRELPSEKPAPPPAPALPVARESPVPKTPLGTFSALERVKASIRTPVPPGATPLPPLDLELEFIDDDTPAPPPRQTTTQTPQSPDPASSSEAVLLEDAAPPPAPKATRPGREAIASTPTQIRPRGPAFEEEVQDVEAVDDEDEDGEEPRERRASSAAPSAAWFVGMAVAVVLWMVLTPLAFFYLPVAYATLVTGFGICYVGNGGLNRLARQQGMSRWRLRLIPFYQVYYMSTFGRPALVPFLTWVCGQTFLVSGGGAVGFHIAVNAHKPLADLSTPQAVDAEAARLLLGKNKEARAWLRQPENRNEPESRRLVEGAYGNGAKEVMVVGLDDADNGIQFVIVLPADAAARQKLFDWHREVDPTVKDVGQKYLLLAAE
jgi:hypothetical protein